jgi:hypothetical protein
MNLFDTTKVVEKPQSNESVRLTKSLLADTESYLAKHLKDYISWKERDPEDIAQVCRIVDALSKLGKIIT